MYLDVVHVVEVPGVGVLVGQHAPAVLARDAAAAGVGRPHVLGQTTPALANLVTNITLLGGGASSGDCLPLPVLHLLVLILILLEADADEAHGVVPGVAVDGELVLALVLVALQLDVVGVDHDDAGVVIRLVVTHCAGKFSVFGQQAVLTL